MIKGPFEDEKENQKLQELYNTQIEREISKMILSEEDFKKESSSGINIKRFLEVFIADIILELNEKFPETNYSMYVNYRIKSPKTAAMKLEDYIKRVEIGDRLAIKEITDLIGMRIVITKIPHAIILGKDEMEDPAVQRLITERTKNQEASKKFEKVRSKILETGRYNEIEYYQECKKVIEKLLETIHTSQKGKKHTYASELKKTYHELERYCEEKISFDTVMGETEREINIEDIQRNISSKKVDFIRLLDDFNERIDSKLALKIYSNYLPKLFQKSDNLRALGASVSNNEDRTKKKREESGFVADFYGIDFEEIPLQAECQIMHIDEYVASSIGYSAHAKLAGKDNEPALIPSVYAYQKMKGIEKLKTVVQITQEEMHFLRKIIQIKELTGEEAEYIKEIIDTKVQKKESKIENEKKAIWEQICILSEEQKQELKQLFYQEGCTAFSNWAENITSINGMARLDLDSFAKNRVKFVYDDPYERLAHILRRQVEGYNLDSSYAEMVEEFLGRVYKNKKEWLQTESVMNPTSSVIDFEIREYIEEDLPKLKGKCRESVIEEFER